MPLATAPRRVHCIYCIVFIYTGLKKNESIKLCSKLLMVKKFTKIIEFIELRANLDSFCKQ